MPEPLNLFAPAARQKTKLRMALQGVSGGGKTLSALYIAYGMTGDWGKVALIDTEHDRALEYAARSDLPIPTGQFLQDVYKRQYLNSLKLTMSQRVNSRNSGVWNPGLFQ